MKQWILAIITTVLMPFLACGMFLLFVIAFPVNVILIVLALIMLGILLEVIRRKMVIKRMKFVLVCEAPSVVLSIIVYLVVAYLDSINYWTSGFMPGLGEYVLSLTYMATAGSVLGVTLLINLVLYIKKVSEESREK